ncbi:hypothetical protein KEM56_005900 [Ascosphaera pollenicola]|nr:hypothetical protein KEM56_005900 [Ascosphaera pollenicola]
MPSRKQISMREACRLAIERIPYSSQQLHFHRPVYEGDQSDPGLYAIACFRDLNELLFRGVLQLHHETKKPNVVLRWAEPDGTNLGYTRFGYTSTPGVDDEDCTVITLNEYLKRLGNWGGDILAALIHEMAHAYFIVCCGWRAKGQTGPDGKEHILEHDINYCALLYKIQDVLNVTYAAYTDLFRCLPLQGDHAEVHDVPPYVFGRSCCDWMGIHKPSDEEIQSYIWELLNSSVDETLSNSPLRDFNGTSQPSIGAETPSTKPNGYKHEDLTIYSEQQQQPRHHKEQPQQQLDSLKSSPHGNHANGNSSDSTRLDELEAKLKASDIENRRLRESLLKILSMAAEGHFDTTVLQQTAQDLGTNFTMLTPPPTAHQKIASLGSSPPANGATTVMPQDIEVTIHRQARPGDDHHKYTTPRGEMSPTRSAAQSLREALDPGRNAVDGSALSDAGSDDDSRKPIVHSQSKAGKFDQSKSDKIMNSSRYQSPALQEYTYEAVPPINREEDTDDYEVGIELEDGTYYVLQRQLNPLTPRDLRLKLTSERKAFPSEETFNRLLEMEILKPDPDAEEKEDLIGQAEY